MKKTIALLASLALAFTAQAQHERQIVETTPLSRLMLTFDSAGQWLNVLGTNLFPTNFPALAPAQIFIGSAAGAAIATNVSGDVTANTNGVFTLANSGVTAGIGVTKVTVNAKGLITGTNSLAAGDIPGLPASQITSGVLGSVYGGTGFSNLPPSEFYIGGASSNTTQVSMSGDATMGNTGVVTLANSGVSAGSATKVTFGVKGLITATNSLNSNDIPALPWSKITSGTPTTLSGYGITDGLATALTTTNTNNAFVGTFSGPQLNNVVIANAPNGIQIKGAALGSPATIGVSTLVGGSVIVTNTAVTSTTLIFLSHATTGGTLGELTYAISAGVSFTITSSSGTDTSTVNWLLIQKN